MNDDYTNLSPLDKPLGPRARPPLQRMLGLKYRVPNFHEALIEMSKKKPKGKNASGSNSSSPNTSNSSPTRETSTEPLNSSSEYEEERRRRMSNTKLLYPDLENSQLDESLTSTPTKTGIRSPNDTKKSKLPDSDNSFNKDNESLNKKTPSPPKNKQKLRFQNESKESVEKTGYSDILSFIAIPIMLALFGILYYYFGWSIGTAKTEEETFDFQTLKSNLKDLKQLFPSQNEEIWTTFGSGILDLKKKRVTPGVFVLLSDHNETNNCLAKKVAELARDILKGTGDVILNPNELENDIGKVHTLMENRMPETKVVVFPDILSFQPKAIQAFHEMCDEYNTLISEAVYIFTMNSIFHSKSVTLTHFVEKELRNKFSNDINHDTLNPLIIRLTTGGVLSIKKEEKIPCS